jgi:uncharacterized protein (TIGR04255 family)
VSPAANFELPPVGEVSFGLSFVPLTSFKIVHFGAFWDLIREDYPECDDKPQVFDAPNAPISVTEWFPLPRVWYLHRARNYLIQLQPNRIWFNWRRLTDAEEYPRFDALAPRFRSTVKQFVDFANNNNIGPVNPMAAELTYVNQVPAGEVWQEYSDVGNFMEDVRWSGGRTLLPKPSGIAWRAEFQIGSDKLSVELKSGEEITGAKRRMFFLEIRASTILPVAGVLDHFDWFNRANHLIVNAFCELTTKKAQNDYWKRTGG